jgi:hypothetical protein
VFYGANLHIDIFINTQHIGQGTCSYCVPMQVYQNVQRDDSIGTANTERLRSEKVLWASKIDRDRLK